MRAFRPHRFLFIVLCALGLGATVRANHYLGADITYVCQGNNNYLITLDVFLDCAGTPLVPQSLSVASSCGSSYVINNLSPVSQEEVSQVCDGQLGNTTCNGGPLLGVMRYRFQQSLPLPPCANWTLSWNICCRGVALDLAGTQGIYVESTLNNLGGVCDNSPVFGELNMPTVCTGELVETNLGVTDPDGDRLAYSFVNARYYTGVQVEDVEYQVGYDPTQPVPGTVLDTATGQLSFTPPLTGQYVFAVKVDSYDSNDQLRGSVVRDFRFVSIACTNTPPQAVDGGVSDLDGGILTDARSISVCGGSTVCFNAAITDADVADLLDVSNDIATALPGAIVQVSGTDTVTAQVCWDTGSATPGDHVFTIIALDHACPIPHTQLYTYHVIVGAPVDAGPDQLTCAEQPVQLNAGPDAVFYWSVVSGEPITIGSNFSCDSCASPLASPSTTTVYTALSASGCADEVTVTVALPTDPLCLGLGIRETGTPELTVHPNPSNGQLHLSGVDVRAFEVIDVLGRIRASGTWTSGELQRTVDLPQQLAPGQYVLRVWTAAGDVHTSRFELVR